MRKTKFTNLIGGLLFASAVSLCFTACSKSDYGNGNGNGGYAQLQVSLTDAPGDYRAVYIDVEDVNVNYSDNADYGWQTLPGFKKGIYNLLTLVNGNDAVLADASIATGTIKEIRLVLGDNNWVVTNSGDSVKLQTPSGQSSGIKLKINMAVSDGILYKLLLDFNVAKSIHSAGSAGKYVLNPVIRTILEAQGGSISGVVVPAVVPSAVLLINGTDTVASTYTGLGGAYLLRGIDAGTYSLHVISTDSTLAPASVDGISVTTGKVTVADTIRLSAK